jgi:hypothetical protein
MNVTLQLVGALSNDLYRAATALHRNSTQTASCFLEESNKRILELQESQPDQFIQNIITVLKEKKDDSDAVYADKLLTYSIMLQNYVLRKSN